MDVFYFSGSLPAARFLHAMGYSKKARLKLRAKQIFLNPEPKIFFMERTASKENSKNNKTVCSQRGIVWDCPVQYLGTPPGE